MSDIDRAIIQKCYDKLLIAVGYPEAMDDSDDWRQALNTMHEYAIQQIERPAVPDSAVQDAIEHLDEYIRAARELITECRKLFDALPDLGETVDGVDDAVLKLNRQAAQAIDLAARLDALADKFGSIAPDLYIRNLEHSCEIEMEHNCDLQAENERLKAELVEANESAICIKQLTDDHALIDGDVQKLVIITLWKMFHESGAENYLAMGVRHGDEDYELTMQKKDKLSPADLNMKLKAELASLKGKLDRVREWCGQSARVWSNEILSLLDEVTR